VASYLGPTQFGLLNYAIGLVSLFASVATMGLNTLVVRDIACEPECQEETLGTAVVQDIACEPECQEETLGTAFILQLAGGIITLLLAVTAIALVNPKESLTLWLVGIVAAGTMFQSC
jgi:O-antigen/teichoic acid export membrane protein